MSGLFEHLAATDDSAIIAARKAAAVANKRAKDHFGAFLANAAGHADLKARLALVEDDLTTIVNDVVAEYGGDAQKIEAAVKHAMGELPMGAPGGMPMGAPGAMPGAMGGGTCPDCGGATVNGQCPTCQGGGAYGGAAGAQGGAYGLTHSIPQTQSTGPVQAHTAKGGYCDECKGWKHKGDCSCTAERVDAEESGSADDGGSTTSSFRVARRPKLCPYHSEVVDVSLGAGDASAGFNAMASHAWGDNHCKGAYEGTCNFKPAMVTQQYWDDKRAEYDDRREQRELERQTQPAAPELSIDTEPIMHAEPLPVEPGKEGVSDIDGELADAPSAVGSGEPQPTLASLKEAEALTTVDLPTGGESALGGPSPKIDKSPSGDERGWTLEPIDTQGDGSPHPTIEQDPTDKADYNKEDFLDQTRAVTESETLPTEKGDAGFNGDRNIKQYPTKTFGDNGTAPVTRDSLSSTHTAIAIDDMPMMQPGGSQQPNMPSPGTPEYDQWLQQQRAQMQALPSVPQAAQADYQNNQQMPPGWKGLGSGSADYLTNRGTATSAVDPDKNPIREIVEEFQGFLPPAQVESAIKDWTVG